jgi:hypothetical protein
MIEACALCSRRFQRRSNRQRFCSPACRAVAKTIEAAGRYDKGYRRQRDAWRARVACGGVPCARCHEPIVAGVDKWDLDHLDNGLCRPSHRYCNRAQPGLEAAGKPVQRPSSTPSRQW